MFFYQYFWQQAQALATSIPEGKAFYRACGELMPFSLCFFFPVPKNFTKNCHFLFHFYSVNHVYTLNTTNPLIFDTLVFICTLASYKLSKFLDG